MVARRIVRSVVVVVEPETSTAEARVRPSDLLPWADPYIASLVRGLQDEVRQERQAAQWRPIEIPADDVLVENEASWSPDLSLLAVAQ